MPRRLSSPILFAAALGLAATAGLVLAQDNASDDGLATMDVSGSFEVDNVQVDVTGPNADAARYGGWRLAQRRGWQMLSQRMGRGTSSLPDGALDSLVTGIVIQNEQIGPNRYVAQLGILFSRARAGAILGVQIGATRSPPLLTVPVEWTGGAGVAFEQHTDWQDAWTRFRAANSSIDYVRPAGTGPDPLLLNTGQINRRDRGWWRTILDQYSANGILIPVVHLSRQWPGGPIIGRFEARYGPDNQLLTSFTLRVGDGDGLAALLDAGVRRIDEAYQGALSAGLIGLDSSLNYIPPVMPTPTATPTDLPTALPTGSEAPVAPTIDVPPLESTNIDIQADTPSAASVFAVEAAMRAIPGVRAAQTTSLAVGGVSIVRVVYDADPAVLRTSLESRGWIVQGSGATLRIRRAAPGGPADNSDG